MQYVLVLARCSQFGFTLSGLSIVSLVPLSAASSTQAGKTVEQSKQTQLGKFQFSSRSLTPDGKKAENAFVCIRVFPEKFQQ